MHSYIENGKSLGAIYEKERTTFRVWSPRAESVTVNLYHTGSDAEEGAGLIRRDVMYQEEGGVWQTVSKGDLHGIYYTYTVCTGGIFRETADIYATACGVNGERSMVIDHGRLFTPDCGENEKWQKKRRELSKCPVIYELHIKDFSWDAESGVSKSNRGRYLAFTEKDSYCMRWIKSLGITHVHLLPFFDFGSVDEEIDDREQFNWGYDPVNYNVPEGSYSSDAYHGEIRIQECHQMIQALHEEGIGVIMDVVYNHTYSTDSAFERTVPGYYYRKEEDGSYANGSLCNNDTASEQEMFRQYMIDSVCYWASEYQVDGFRFDLMGLHDVETMNQIRLALDRLPGGRDILMYGEPWSGDYSPMREGCLPATKENIGRLHERISIFCDDTRDAIKGDVFLADEAGYVNGEAGNYEAVKDCVLAWTGKTQTGWRPKNQGQIISYVSAHDNFTLWDKLIYTLPENEGRKRKKITFEEKNAVALRQNKMAAGIYFTCLGIPFFQAGEEFARTKQGLSNSYNAPASLNALSWERSREYGGLAEFYRGLIEFRKEWIEIYEREASDIKVCFEEAKEPEIVAFRIGRAGVERELYVIYNPTKERMMHPIPPGSWQTICDGDTVYTKERNRPEIRDRMLVKNQAVMILGKGA